MKLMKSILLLTAVLTSIFAQAQSSIKSRNCEIALPVEHVFHLTATFPDSGRHILHSKGYKTYDFDRTRGDKLRSGELYINWGWNSKRSIFGSKRVFNAFLRVKGSGRIDDTVLFSQTGVKNFDRMIKKFPKCVIQ